MFTAEEANNILMRRRRPVPFISSDGIDPVVLKLVEKLGREIEWVTWVYNNSSLQYYLTPEQLSDDRILDALARFGYTHARFVENWIDIAW